MAAESKPSRMKTTVEIYECPRCGRLRFPEGDEAQYGPPECDHGLWFGDGPDGGGESEMVLTTFARVWADAPKVADIRKLTRSATEGSSDADN